MGKNGSNASEISHEAESFGWIGKQLVSQLNIWNSTLFIISTAITFGNSKSHKRFGCHLDGKLYEMFWLYLFVVYAICQRTFNNLFCVKY